MNDRILFECAGCNIVYTGGKSGAAPGECQVCESREFTEIVNGESLEATTPRIQETRQKQGEDSS